MSVDLETFATHLRTNALQGFGSGRCARWVRQALEAAGADTTGHPVNAKDWGPLLLRNGFRTINVDNPDIFRFIKGDIMIMDPYQGGSPAGHIAGFDGRIWISDFLQRDFWAGPRYRQERPRYVVYRR